MTTTKSTVNHEHEENLQRAAVRIREQLANAERHDVQARYAVACICLEVRDEKMYGKDGLASVQKEIKPAKSTLYRYAKVAEIWAPAEFRAATSVANSKNLPLTWSHWEVLAGVADDAERDALLSNTLKESLSVRDLARAVKDLIPIAQAPHETAPDDVWHMSRAFEDHLALILKEAQDVESRVIARAAAGSTKPMNSELSQLESLSKQIEAALQVLTALAKKVKAITKKSTGKERAGTPKAMQTTAPAAQEATTA